MTMPVYVIVPTNDRGKSVSRITVRTTPVTNAYIAGPKRDCGMQTPTSASTPRSR